MHAVPEPFVAYLRVYEPLSSFAPSIRDRLDVDLDRGAVDAIDAGAREQKVWLRTQVNGPARLLPGETPDGTAQERGDVLVLDEQDVPSGPAASVGPGPLVCPLDLRGRSAAALVGFIGSAEVPLRNSALTQPLEAAKNKANAVVSELADSAVHVLSSTWTVPLPWFVLVDPEERAIVPSDCGGRSRVSWRVAMADARRRVARAHSVTRDSLGEEGPTKILKETGRWLERFHPHSAVELDYGGLARFMTDEDLEVDTSAEDVHVIIDALESGDSEEVGERYEALRDHWSRFAARERYN